MMNDLISIIIPTFNRAHTLARAIDSVLKQTHKKRELIIIDDGSTDKTREVLSTYENIIYKKQTQQGVSAARNAGIKLAQGQWLAFLDSDDYWLENKLTTQLGLLQQNKTMKVCHTEEIWLRNGVRVNPMKKHTKLGGDIFKHCVHLCLMSPSSIIIHRDVFDVIGLFDESLPACEDYDLWLRITARFPVLFCQVPLIVKTGGHDDQLSKHYWGMDRFRIKALHNILQMPDLKAQYKVCALKALVKKLNVYLNGARKRGKVAEVNQWLSVYGHYLTDYA